MKKTSTVSLDLGKVKGIFLLADTKQVHQSFPEPDRDTTVKLEITQELE